MGFLSGIFDFFSNASSWLLQQIITVLYYLAGLIQAVAIYLAQAIIAVLNFLFSALVQVGKFFQVLWEQGIKRVLYKILVAAQHAHSWLEDHLAPVLKFLKRVRDLWDRYFNLYVRPILNTIQRMRQFLLVLRLLGVKQAEALDRRLRQIESGITRVFLETRGILNSVIDVVNGLSSPSNLARLVLVSVAGRRVFAALVRLHTGLPVGHFFPNYSSGALPWEKPVSSSADLISPLRNPPASSILGGISFPDVFSFTSTAPPVTDATIDSSEPYPAFSDVVTQFLNTEAALKSAGNGLISLREMLETDTGLVADAGRGHAGAFLALLR